MVPLDSEILILGAGLQGTGVALELARRGIDVTLVERDPRPVNRASLRNEGKIHLGLIYANETTRETAFLQLRGALTFHRTVARWIDPTITWLARSTPFHYLVACDSVLAPERLVEHYAAVEERCAQECGNDPRLDYLGERPSRLVRRLSVDEIAVRFDPTRFAAGFASTERAVDCDLLAAALRRCVEDAPRIRFLPSHAARAVFAEGDGFRVEGEGPDGPWRARARQLVNATWERRVAFDQQLGIPAPSGLLHRLKYRVIARLPRELRTPPR